MIGPGLIVAVTLASTHASPPDAAPDEAHSGTSGAFCGGSDAEMATPFGDCAPLADPNSGVDIVAGGPHEGRSNEQSAAAPFTDLLTAFYRAAEVPAETSSLTESPPPADALVALDAPEAGSRRPSPPEELDKADALPFLMADTVTLDPTLLRGMSRNFVSRLQRVAERMWNEHELRVEIVEGFRGQGRQDALFTQGRTTPGPVVTWTRNSMHTDGLAADLYIGGAPVTPGDALLLAGIAREEGLSTLYPLDSGHIQLETGRPGEGPEGPLERAPFRTPLPAAPRRGVAPVAPVAPVAQPARVDGIAQGELRVDPSALTPLSGETVLAESRSTLTASTLGAAALAEGLAAPTQRGPTIAFGSAESGRAGEMPEAWPTARVNAPEVPADEQGARPALRITPDAPLEARPEDKSGTDVGPGDGHEAARAKGEPSISGTVLGQNASRPATAAPHSLLGIPQGAGAERAATAPPITGATAVDLSRFEALDTAPLYQRLRVPIEGLGEGSSLSVGLRGSTVDAQLSLTDPLLAKELGGHLHELRQQLAVRRVEAGELVVRVVSDTPSDTSTRPSTESELKAPRGTSSGSMSGGDPQRERSGRSRDLHDRDDGALPQQKRQREEQA